MKLVDKSLLKSLKGDGLATKGVNLKLLVEDSKIDAKETALRLLGNADVRLRKGSVVHGDKEGLRSDYNLKLSVEGATLDSAGPAVTSASNAEVRVLAGSTIKGTPAFSFSSKPTRLEVADGTTTGETQQDVRGGAPSAPGLSDVSAMRRAIEVSMAQVKASCKDPKKGTVNVQMMVLPTGRVGDVRVTSSTASKAAEVCVVSKLRASTFPARSGPTTVNTNYSLN